MTRLLTAFTLASLFATTAMAEPAPDVPSEPAPQTCDSSQFANKGQWVKCLVHSGVHGKELARRIHDEHQARKGGETTEKSKARAKMAAKKAEQRARDAR